MSIALALASPAAATAALRTIQGQIAKAGGWHPSVPAGEREAMEAECAEALLRIALRAETGVAR